MAELKRLLGPRALLARPEKEVYRYDAILVGPEPLAVVLPETREEVQALVRLARAYGLPLVPRGAGSGLSGGSVPQEGAIVVAFTRMARLEVDPHARTAWAEPGVTTARISEAARPFGLFYPPDPASY
ncbi:FAD-dependent oxidoreductase, partial [Shewanella sp. C31]|nr:FAD-dependent oxidoreductase [Shewanella electrica]